MISMHQLTIGFLLLTVTSTAYADGTNKNWWEKDPVYLSKQAVSIKEVLTPPPAAHSSQDEADIREILTLQKQRSEKECERAKTEVSVTLETFFGPKYGPLSEEQVKQWNAFFENVRTDTDYFVQETKRQWKRPRPYVANASVHPCTPLEKTDAYPSGHAAISRVFADVLSLIDPKHEHDFKVRADQIAHDRILAGIHHPSDIESGKKIGDAVFKVLVKNKKFQQDLKKLKITQE